MKSKTGSEQELYLIGNGVTTNKTGFFRDEVHFSEIPG
jgi:chemotaxis methyl-accepting protein methylase